MKNSRRVAVSLVYGFVALGLVLLGVAIEAEGFIGFPILIDGVEPILDEQSWPVNDLLAILPTLFFVTALILGGLVIYVGLSVWSQRYALADRARAMRLRRIAPKTEVGAPDSHEQKGEG